MLSYPDNRLHLRGEVEVDPRSESDQAKDFSLPQEVARLGITDDPSCDETRNLDQENFEPILRFQDQGILLVEKGRLVYTGYQKSARKIIFLKNLSGDGRPVEMDIEEGHEDAHLQRFFVQETVFLTFPDMHDPAVGRRKDDVLKVGNLSPGIPEEIGDEQGDKDSQRHPDLPAQDSENHR